MIVFLILPMVIFLKHWKIRGNYRCCRNLKEKKTRPQLCPLTPPTMREIYMRVVIPAPLSQTVEQEVQVLTLSWSNLESAQQSEFCLRATSLELKGIISSGAASLFTCSPAAIVMFRLRPCILGLGNGERVMGMIKGGRTPFGGTRG